MGIGGCTEGGGAAAEDLCFRFKLGMNLQPDNRFKFHRFLLKWAATIRLFWATPPSGIPASHVRAEFGTSPLVKIPTSPQNRKNFNQ